MPVPALSNNLKKGQWETHRGLLAKVATKVVSTHGNLSKLLADIEKTYAMLVTAVTAARNDPAKTKQAEAVAKMFADKLKDVADDSNDLRAALDKPLLKTATSKSITYLRSMNTDATTLATAVGNTNALLA